VELSTYERMKVFHLLVHLDEVGCDATSAGLSRRGVYAVIIGLLNKT
jgi:hypothetical protein